jgi:hypothetical protein
LDVVELGQPAWDATLAAVPSVDVFYRPEYCRFRAEAQPHAPVMLRFEDPLGIVFDVTLRKSVSALPFYAALARTQPSIPIDLASPEYNGPVVVGAAEDAPELLRRYRAAVDEYCREAAVVTEFVRVHPLDAAPPLASLDPLGSVSEAVYVDVRDGYEQAFARYRKEHRTAIRKALEKGAEVRFVEPTPEAISRFASLYLDTMDRKDDVKSYYLHERRYFECLFAHLGKSALLLESWAGGAPASATVSLVGPRYVWYLYGGSRAEGLATGANKLLLDRLIAWCAENGKEALVLCGGFQAGDGLYLYKRGFSKQSAPVFQLRKVHDAEALQRLQAAKAAHDSTLGRPTRLDYFPSYWLD